MKNKHLYILSIVFAFFVLFFPSCLTKEQKADRMIEQINRLCPYEQNGVQFDHLKKVGSNTVEMKMTFLHESMGDFGDMGPALENGFKNIILQLVQDENNFKAIREANMTMKCVIYKGNGAKIMDFSISPEEYNAENDSEYKIDSKKSKEENVASIIKTIIDAMKPHLPEVDAETGIETSDVYFNDMTFTTVNMFPDDVIKEFESEFEDEDPKEVIRELMLYTIQSNPSMRTVAENGVYIEFIIKRKDGEIYTQFILSPEEVMSSSY